MLNPYDYAYNPYSYEDYSYYDYGGSGDAAYGVPPAAPSGNTGSVNIDDLMANISLWYPGGFDFANFTKEKGWQLTDTNIHCEFKGVKCNISKSFTPVLTEYGLCYTFNAVPNSKPRVFQDQPGIGNGLKLIVNIEQSEYTNKMERGDPIEVGLLFQVHNQSEPPMMETKSLAVPPGFHAYAGVKRTDSAEMEPPYGICDRASPLKYYSVYTMSACVQECKLDHMMGNCTCKLLNYPGPGEVCSPKQIVECVKPILLEIKKNFTHMCPCKIPCQSVNYETYLSYAKLPSDETAPEVAMEYGVAQSDIEKNILVLDIFFQDLNYVISEQLPAIESSGLISDLGGQFGLFMGFSLLTLVEFIEFGFTRLILFICRPKKKKRTITPVLPKEQSNSKSAYHY
ncbi:acid-sensing ion channel 1 [Lingula anatina]|uniref:Acid-sensing ion channel 1 n=1 Tax=Lingula anatina TaxID=7574 RepID=A0A1S3HVR7_LINAN|nr:acid-sensing ion channel 1 [Lingula anatina]|eukprot:XP_013390137.1 acid-sensing ion channel 1 [Lingula anatina]